MTTSDELVPPAAAALPTWELDFLARRTRALLEAQVPLSLLLDLADPLGPDSRAVYAAEPPDGRWLDSRTG